MNLSLKSKEVVLKVLIGVVALMIVVVLAVGVSVIRSHMEMNEAVINIELVPPEPAIEESVEERMARMHQEGNAEPTAEEIALMETMNASISPLSEADRIELLEAMQNIEN